jgi:cell volume regulation protein A
MDLHEPTATAIFLTTFGALLAVSVLTGRLAARVGLPLTTLFLLLGMLAGSQGIGGIAFTNYALTFKLGTTALVLILFDGGLNTSLAEVRQVGGAAGALATLGVLGTAAFTAFGAWLMGLPVGESFLLGAVVSPTDAAAVFSVLRGSGVHLKRRVALTLEAESGLNDPLAFILVTLVTLNIAQPSQLFGWHAVAELALQVTVGVACGVVIGYGGRAVVQRVPIATGGLYPVFTLAIAFLSFGVPTLLHGSGFLSVYIAGMILGSGELPQRASLLRVHDALGWLGQVAMFLVLGLLVFPSHLVDVAWLGIALALFIALVARPLVVAICLAPFGFRPREIAFIGWMGLRGAVPIILATVPVLAGVPGAEPLFDLVFFFVLISSLVQGGTGAWMARRLGLETREPPAPHAVLAIESTRPLQGRLISFHVDEALAVAGATISELPLPAGAAVALIVRGTELVAPLAETVLRPGDHVYLVSRAEDGPLLQLMFGRPESDD